MRDIAVFSFIALCTILIILGFSFFSKESVLKPRSLVVGEAEFAISIADTPLERLQGLSGREVLPKGEGLFFIFDTSDFHGIWMKDMLFPIDIIWLDEEFKIVDVEEHVAPETYPTIFKPEVPSRYVLELPAGDARRHEIAVGSRAFLR